ncbi:MAG: hypothetical protein ACRELB_08310 [Polyangiaceae bacterium]
MTIETLTKVSRRAAAALRLLALAVVGLTATGLLATPRIVERCFARRVPLSVPMQGFLGVATDLARAWWIAVVLALAAVAATGAALRVRRRHRVE